MLPRAVWELTLSPCFFPVLWGENSKNYSSPCYLKLWEECKGKLSSEALGAVFLLDVWRLHYFLLITE